MASELDSEWELVYTLRMLECSSCVCSNWKKKFADEIFSCCGFLANIIDTEEQGTQITNEYLCDANDIRTWTGSANINMWVYVWEQLLHNEKHIF